MALPIPTPATWIVGEDVTATELNTQLRDAISFFAMPPLAQLYQLAAAQSVSSGTNFVAVALDATNLDTYGGHSNTTNNSRYVAQIPGWYFITATVAYNASTSGTRTVDIWQNGSPVAGSGAHVQLATTPTSHDWAGTTDGFFYLNVGDYVEIYTWQDSGSTLSTVGAGTGDLCPAMTVFWMHQ